MFHVSKIMWNLQTLLAQLTNHPTINQMRKRGVQLTNHLLDPNEIIIIYIIIYYIYYILCILYIYIIMVFPCKYIHIQKRILTPGTVDASTNPTNLETTYQHQQLLGFLSSTVVPTTNQQPNHWWIRLHMVFLIVTWPID